MKKLIILLLFAAAFIPQNVFAAEIYDDPETIYSYKSLVLSDESDTAVNYYNNSLENKINQNRQDDIYSDDVNGLKELDLNNRYVSKPHYGNKSVKFREELNGRNLYIIQSNNVNSKPIY
ncbi:MAG: hypothetical protein Q8920_03205 [Bacillota bacterium]|nr:hypothetical protein [Bacillota bacterium]